MENKDKSFTDLNEAIKKLIKAFVDLTLKLIDPIVKKLMWFIEDLKKIFNQLFNDKKIYG